MFFRPEQLLCDVMLFVITAFSLVIDWEAMWTASMTYSFYLFFMMTLLTARIIKATPRSPYCVLINTTLTEFITRVDIIAVPLSIFVIINIQSRTTLMCFEVCTVLHSIFQLAYFVFHVLENFNGQVNKLQSCCAYNDALPMYSV